MIEKTVQKIQSILLSVLLSVRNHLIVLITNVWPKCCQLATLQKSRNGRIGSQPSLIAHVLCKFATSKHLSQCYKNSQ